MKTSEYPFWLAVPHDGRGTFRKSTGYLANGQSAIKMDEKEWDYVC